MLSAKLRRFLGFHLRGFTKVGCVILDYLRMSHMTQLATMTTPTNIDQQ
jgi:hypothetical protein